MDRSYSKIRKAYSAKDIANFLVFLMSDSCEDLSNMKLNKILYYAQGHYLQKEGVVLFEDEIEAWPHGPVIRSVYKEYKKYANAQIKEYDRSRIDVIDDEIKSFLVDIARKYGRYTAAALRNMTHQPKTPWAETTEEGVIGVELIHNYFVQHEERITPLHIEFSDEDIVNTRDDNGVIILPEEWLDE